MTRSLSDTWAAAQRGDRAALDALFARHLPPLVAFLRNKAGGIVVQRESVHDLESFDPTSFVEAVLAE